jgi:hypothetical protein
MGPTMRSAARESDPVADAAARRDRRNALLRFGLANAQMVAAIVALVLAFRLGLTWPVAVAAFVSFALSAVSRSLRRPPPPPTLSRSINPK